MKQIGITLAALVMAATAAAAGQAAPPSMVPPPSSLPSAPARAAVPATPAAVPGCDCVLVPRAIEQTEIAYLQSMGTIYGPQNVLTLASTALACLSNNPDANGRITPQMPDACPAVSAELAKMRAAQLEMPKKP